MAVIYYYFVLRVLLCQSIRRSWRWYTFDPTVVAVLYGRSDGHGGGILLLHFTGPPVPIDPTVMAVIYGRSDGRGGGIRSIRRRFGSPGAGEEGGGGGGADTHEAAAVAAEPHQAARVRLEQVLCGGAAQHPHAGQRSQPEETRRRQRGGRPPA
eukprot:646859-Prorocentrum_minimum.AAC.5